MATDDVSADDLATLLGISTRTLTDLAKRGHLVKATRGRYRLAASVTAYCAHLRGIAAGRGGDDQVTTLTAQRARLAREQADAVALKNDAARGSMVSAAEVEREWSDVLRTIRACMLAVPLRVQQRLPHITRTDVEVIQMQVREALTSLARANDQDLPKQG